MKTTIGARPTLLFCFVLASMLLVAISGYGQPVSEDSPTVTLLVDNFTTNSGLNTSLWTANSAFLKALAAASSNPPATFVPPQLTFSRQFGMQMTGPNQDYETTGVQSLSTFTPPFKVITYVIAAQATANPFEIFL